MWRMLLHPYILITILIVSALAYRWWQRSRLRHRVSQLPPKQKLSLVLQLLRVISLFFRRI